jgi:hypothetical protein
MFLEKAGYTSANSGEYPRKMIGNRSEDFQRHRNHFRDDWGKRAQQIDADRTSETKRSSTFEDSLNNRRKSQDPGERRTGVQVKKGRLRGACCDGFLRCAVFSQSENSWPRLVE